MSQPESFDLPRLKKRASAALRKGRRKKALALYRRILEVEPDNLEIHQKIAPLLVRARQPEEALASYRRAVDGLLRQGFDEKAIGLLHAAARQLPHEQWLWQSAADLEAGRGHTADAIETLLLGAQGFRPRRHRLRAIELLIHARKLDRSHFRATYELARLLGKSGGRRRALRLLDELAAAPHSRHLRRIRARQLWLAPGPRSLWRLARAVLLGR